MNEVVAEILVRNLVDLARKFSWAVDNKTAAAEQFAHNQHEEVRVGLEIANVVGHLQVNGIAWRERLKTQDVGVIEQALSDPPEPTELPVRAVDDHELVESYRRALDEQSADMAKLRAEMQSVRDRNDELDRLLRNHSAYQQIRDLEETVERLAEARDSARARYDDLVAQTVAGDGAEAGTNLIGYMRADVVDQLEEHRKHTHTRRVTIWSPAIERTDNCIGQEPVVPVFV